MCLHYGQTPIIVPDRSRPHEMGGSAESVLRPYVNLSMPRTFLPLLWHSLNNWDSSGSANADGEKWLSDKTKPKIK